MDDRVVGIGEEVGGEWDESEEPLWEYVSEAGGMSQVARRCLPCFTGLLRTTYLHVLKRLESCPWSCQNCTPNSKNFTLLGRATQQSHTHFEADKKGYMNLIR
jgi:hypothetical protein